MITTGEEIWTETGGYPGYLVSTYGDVLSLKRGCHPLAKARTDKGYLRVSLCGETRFIHRLVATAFITKPEGTTEWVVNHLDGDRTNNHVGNLEWVTTDQNNMYILHEMGRRDGTRTSFSETDIEEVDAWRKSHVNEYFSPGGLESALGITREQLSWAHWLYRHGAKLVPYTPGIRVQLDDLVNRAHWDAVLNLYRI